MDNVMMHLDSNPLTLTDHFCAGAPPPPPFFHNPNITHVTSSYSAGGNMASMREMIFRIAVMQPVHIDPEAVKAPKRRNVRISKDPQSVAARHRRERISEKIRILQRLVPGGTKMDTASMLDEAIHYVKFLKKQVQSLEVIGNNAVGFPVAGGGGNGNNMGHLLKGSCGQPPVVSHGAMQQHVLR